jgi:hypothetical protein
VPWAGRGGTAPTPAGSECGQVGRRGLLPAGAEGSDTALGGELPAPVIDLDHGGPAAKVRDLGSQRSDRVVWLVGEQVKQRSLMDRGEERLQRA